MRSRFPEIIENTENVKQRVKRVECLKGANALAKQVLSQLSYTPTVGVPFILKHFRPFQNPFPRIFIITHVLIKLSHHGFTPTVLEPARSSTVLTPTTRSTFVFGRAAIVRWQGFRKAVAPMNSESYSWDRAIEPLRNAPFARPRELLVTTGLPWQVGAGNSPWRRVLAGPSPAPFEIRPSGHGRRRGHAGRLAN